MSEGWTLVTGGAVRLGSAICDELEAAGHRILAHTRNTPVKGRESLAGDFSTPDTLREFLRRLEEYEVHYLVNNVGNYETDSALASPVQTWMNLFQVNFFAPLALIQACRPHLKAVVNIGTAGLTHFSGETYASPYHMSKHSLYGLTLSLAKELASEKVRVNMVSPGVLENSVDKGRKKIPLGRFGKTREVARAVRFLIEQEYVTGQNIEVAGGYKL